MFATRQKNRIITIAPSAPPGGLAPDLDLEQSKIEPTPDNSVAPPTTAAVANQIPPDATTQSIASKTAKKAWETPLSSLAKNSLLSHGGDIKNERDDAANLALASKKLYATSKCDSQVIEQDVKDLLQHTAKCEYNICVIEDGKAFTDDMKEMKEDTLYLRKNNKDDIEYQFIGPGRKRISKGDIRHKDLFDKSITYKVPALLNQDTVQPLLPKILDVIYQKEAYYPPLKAEWLAKQNHALILSKTTFTEEWCGKREWKKPLSPLQYAEWAGDTKLSNYYIKLLPADLKNEALQQLKDVRNGHLEREHLSAITELLHAYHYSRKDIWLRQFHSVVHLLQWFCSNGTTDIEQHRRLLSLKSGELLNLSVLDPNGFGSIWGLEKRGFTDGSCSERAKKTIGISEYLQGISIVSFFYETKRADIVNQITKLESSQEKSSCLVM